MIFLLFILCLLSKLCLIKSEDKKLVFALDTTNNSCLSLEEYTFHVGDNVTVILLNKHIGISRLRVSPPTSNGIDSKTNSVTIFNVTEKYNGTWRINLKFNKNNSLVCNIHVNIKPVVTSEIGCRIHVLYLITILILFVMVVAEAIGLSYLICKAMTSRKAQQPKGLTSKEITPQCDVRYIAGPGIKNKKIIPVDQNDRQSEIYEVPDINLGGPPTVSGSQSTNQDTLKSNISLRPPLPLPEEDSIYSELPEISEPAPPVFQTPVRPRPMRTGRIQEKQGMLFPEAQGEPLKPKITPAMLNRAIKQTAPQLSPVPPRKNEPLLPRALPIKNTETPHTIGRQKEPLLPPVPQIKNTAFQLPAVSRPIPGPSTLKKNLNQVGPVPPSVPGPSTAKKPPKPLPPPTPTEAPPMEEQVPYCNAPQQIRDSYDEKEWDYEPLPQYNIYNI